MWDEDAEVASPQSASSTHDHGSRNSAGQRERRYQRTARTITSDGKQKPAKAERASGVA
jgi:hypothetical protein